MHLQLLAPGLSPAVGKASVGWPSIRSKTRLLAAGASVLALGIANPAKLEAANIPGVLQLTEDNIAINLYEVTESDPPVQTGATESASNPGGHALAEAIVNCADTSTCPTPGEIIQYARGTESAANGASIGGSLSIGADAVADGASATAAGVIQIGLWQVAAAEETARNDLDITGSLQIGASADALASSGSGVAFAGIGAGVSQIASSIGIFGSATNSIDNSGDLTVAADAGAEALAGDAAATAFVALGVHQRANGQEAAEADIANSGNVLIAADASAEAPHGFAFATASAAGIIQVANARTQQFASTYTDGAALVGTTSDTPSGPAAATLSNSGSIAVDVEATAVGGLDTTGRAGAFGIAQFVSGSEANAAIDNGGSIAITASADVEGSGMTRGVVFATGLSQVATALSYSTIETIDQNGVLTYELSSTPVGPAVASLANEGDITVAGDVNVVALGTGSLDEGVGVAFVEGFDQSALGDGAQATVDNSGSFNVLATVAVDSGNVSTGVALASGIDQYASAYATQLTGVFASGTTTPTSFTGSATAVGPATASLDNSGSISVIATVDSHGDQVAFGGATASAIGQFAAGTDASVAIDNSGTIVSVGSLSSSGRTAFGSVGAIGFQQGAQGTAVADADFDNGGALAVLAEAEADGEAGAFLNATAFGGVQNVQSDGSASATFVNSGTFDIGAVVSAVAGDTSTFDQALAFANAHGLGQLADGQQAQLEFENSGTFQLLADVHASAGEFALGSAVASGAIQQIALGGIGSGTATASIDNSGSILIGAMADVAAGSTAAALAGVTQAFAQLVIAGDGASAELTNTGSIAMIADAEALAAGGDVTDIASAQAFAFGINAAASSTGVPGFASVNLANAGSIDINGMAHATGSGLAQAIGTAASGLVGSANVVGNGPAEVSLTNSGELTLVGMAEATGGYTAHATGIAVRGMSAFSSSGGDATVNIANSGELTVVADGHASAGTNAIAVAIAIDGFNAIANAGLGDATSNITNSGELNLLANATATALNAQAFAIVGGTLFSGAVLQSAAALNGDASVIANNSGDISVVGHALANGDVIASASAVGGPGVNQFAFATSGDAFSGLNNSGSLEFAAHAEANGANSAYADAVFFNAIGQFASAFGGEGSVQLTNDGSISVGILAEAYGDAAAGALAIASHEIGQVAFSIGSDATVALDNSGSIELDVGAIAEGSVATATAALATGMIQVAQVNGAGEASVALDNSGSIDMAVIASAESPDGAAGAFADLGGAVSQFAAAVSSQFSSGTTGGLTQFTQTVSPTGPASLAFDNSGSLDIAVAAIAEGGASALAQASGNAVTQSARGLDASVSIVNDGSLAIQLGAMAEGDVIAAASGSLSGIVQEAVAAESTVHTTVTAGGGQVTGTVSNPVGTALVSFENSGLLEVAGVADAAADSGSATANMAVKGLDQLVTGLAATAEFANSDEFTVLARAQAAAGTAATATASALGYAVAGDEAFGLDVTNGGKFMVLAEASADGASGQAAAHAIGMEASGNGALSGTIDNGGDLLVRAEAVGGTGDIADATGIRIGTNADGVAVTNTGVLAVESVTGGGTGQATGIGLFDNGSGGAANVTITNDGGVIIARVSDDGGTSWSRGTAIDLAAGSASSILNLVGDGRIHGNIDLASGQTVNVAGGETWFDGIINAECLTGGCGQGTLNIGNGGALFFRHNSAASDGPSGAYLEQLNIATDGTLIFELPAGDDPESAYPQIVTNVANLDGTLLVRSESGLYDSYTFDNVIDADVRNGQFDVCGIDGNPALLELSCVYDGQGNVDLEFERVAFNAVAGLTRNQRAAGSGIEAVYDLDLTGPFADMVGQLFTFGEDDYRDALNQLTGSSHAAYLQSFNALGEGQAMLIGRAIGCELPGSAASSSLSCRPGKLNLWGQIDYANRQHDGDKEALGYDSDRWTAAIGGDVEVGEDIIVGASLAKLSNKLDFHDGGRWNADGIQVGAYGAIDRGNFYAKVIGTLGWFDGDSRRGIDWTDVGGTLAGRLNGDADARLWTLGAHFGYRVTVGASLVTPFLNVDHSSAKLDSFTETGLPGANLAIDDSTSSRTAVTVGAKWAADLGGVVPQAELGYRRLFGDRRATVDAAFAAEAGSDFEVVSATEKRGALLAGVSLGGKAGPVDVRISYQGLFDGNANSHSAGFRIILPFGGK